MKNSGTLIGLGCTFLLAACGGGGGGSASSPVPPPAMPGEPGGLFSGTLEDCGAGCPIDTFAMIDDNGEWFMFFERYDVGVNWGRLTVSGSTFTGTRLRYDPAPSGHRDFGYPPSAPAVLDDPSQSDRSISGNFVERESIQGNFTLGPNSNTRFILDYDDQHAAGSSLATLAGMFSASDATGFSLTYTIDPDGTVSGSDSTGCMVTGNVTAVDPAFNLYRFDLSFAGCGSGAQGAYSGNGALLVSGAPGGENLYLFALSGDETRLVVLDLPRI